MEVEVPGDLAADETTGLAPTLAKGSSATILEHNEKTHQNQKSDDDLPPW